ncbi:hypothetical protein PGTUg99_010966 [Puccinia graminis f. sp. tritici]|uniref:Uncharacterized protein n=1 Tax=Puccinia graminis f. sp. tritici TaxID=56615 RepID=A0A5B0NT84_PUCGR|nr:hypothetical protein PGTUg99_010966 [Puccinia graminis f. sp. tritici]
MVVLSDRVFFCVLFYATGAAQLVLSSIDGPADAAKSLSKYLGNVSLCGLWKTLHRNC